LFARNTRRFRRSDSFVKALSVIGRVIDALTYRMSPARETLCSDSSSAG
jgi:hypothetical protein